ncbi:short-chain dehydrogenase/reductase family protein [Colletotrichum tofieldiae]|uniref:Short-chain dehydrogenase/reductase family protein n=1 Tax=Colletotrichum tofieldiae TaxID=708197 RepID=A0A166V2V1_9PEZI|nr:short-chain dehydrogenase/reductase family protein [Colletotrichum tofieldiae]
MRQTAIVSGVNVGLGLTCAGQMLDHELSRLIIAIRSVEKGEAAAKSLREKDLGATIEVWALDMLSYKSVQAFADRCSTLSRVDVVILNAGMSRQDFHISPEGHEEMVQKAAEKANRLTIVNLGATFGARFPEHDKKSKLLGQLVITKLAEHVPKEDAVINLVDAGLCKGSGLHQHLNVGLRAIFGGVKAITGRSLEEEASTCLDAAVVRGDETHGSYLMDWKIYPNFASFVYTPEGKACGKRLWDETLQELGFAGVRSILRSIQSGWR